MQTECRSTFNSYINTFRPSINKDVSTLKDDMQKEKMDVKDTNSGQQAILIAIEGLSKDIIHLTEKWSTYESLK
jgi:hypothetical protein